MSSMFTRTVPAALDKLTQHLGACRSVFSKLQHRAAAWSLGVLFAMLSGVANAQGAPSTTFDGIEALLGRFQAFIVGPFGRAVTLISIVIAFGTWVLAPKEGIVFPILRVVAAGIAIMNAAVWVTSFGAGA